MSANTEALPAAGAPAAGTTNPWLIAVVVALAVFMEVLDTTIANVALPYIAGGLGVSQDEASWVVTTYLVANAIVITATSFLPQRFGRKAFFLFSLGLFTLSSILCGLAWNSAIASPVPCPAGVRRRRHGAGGAIDYLRTPFRPKNAVRLSRSSGLRWSSRPSLARRLAAGSPTTTVGNGTSSSTARSGSRRWRLSLCW